MKEIGRKRMPADQIDDREPAVKHRAVKQAAPVFPACILRKQAVKKKT